MYQNGITADTTHEGWKAFLAALREWLDSAQGPTSIAYRIERLDPPGVYPRVFTATQVLFSDHTEPTWIYAHVINIRESLVMARGDFKDEDFPMETVRRIPEAA